MQLMQGASIPDSYLFHSQKFFETSVEFSKLEKTEMGGIKGKGLSIQAEKVYEDFREFVKVFAERTYNPLDSQCKVRG